MSYQQCSLLDLIRTTVNFDREYLWNGSLSNRQAKKRHVMNYDFSHVRWKQLGKLWPNYEKM